MRKLITWFPALVSLVTGGMICILFPSIRFTGYLFLGLSALLTCFRLLKLWRSPTARILRRILTVCLCLGLFVAAVTCAFIFDASLGDADRNCEYIIVLGCGVNGTVPSLSLRERINAAYAYLADHPNTICIVSGGQGRGEDITEAACMFRELTAMGIAPERIWLEDRSTSTAENLQFSLAVIEAHTGMIPSEIGIVSSEYHLYRAELMANDLGLTVVGIPGTTGWLALRVNYFLREIAGVWYYHLFGGFAS